MFDVTFKSAALLKKIVTALTDVLKEVQFECSEEGMSVMGMDASHVALVALKINSGDNSAFSAYRCDKPITVSLKVEILAKILKAIGNDETLQIIVEPDSTKCQFLASSSELDRKSTFSVNLLEIDAEHLGVPEADYEAEVQMPAAEFARLMRDLSIHGESLQLNLDKSALKFTVKGDEAEMQVEVNERASKKERVIADKINQMEQDGVKDENETPQIEESPTDPDMAPEDAEGDAEMDDGEGPSLTEIKAAGKQKKQAVAKKDKANDLSKLEEKEGDDPNLSMVRFICNMPIQTIYSLRYMNMFAKAAPLSNYVKLSVSDEQPIIVKFPLETEERGELSFYLAPKIDE